jgi:transposase
VFQGKRIARGLYKTAKGKLLNADVNGSFNIIRKVIPDVLDQETSPIIIVEQASCLFLTSFLGDV